MQLPRTIPEVIIALDEIIEDTVADDNYLGVFAYVYRRTTARILEEVEARGFDDNARMQEVDVRFANLYIKAYHDFKAQNPVSRSWLVSFEVARTRLALIQHLLLGMNAHINLDLAIAASSFMEGKAIGSLSDDFHKVNGILASITNDIQERLSRVSPLLFLLDWIGQRSDEKLADFSITVAREQAWNITNQLWALPKQDRETRIREVDDSIAQFAGRITSPRLRLLKAVLGILRVFETRDKRRIIDQLKADGA